MTAQARRQSTVIVVDDDADTRAVLRHNLSRAGFAVVEAASAEEGMAALLRQGSDLVILDIMMADVDGFGMLSRMRQEPKVADTLVMILTARDDYAARAEAIRLGVVDYLVKPVARTRLLDRIRSNLAVLTANRAAEAALADLAKSAKPE